MSASGTPGPSAASEPRALADGGRVGGAAGGLLRRDVERGAVAGDEPCPLHTPLTHVALPGADTSSVALPTWFVGPTAGGAGLLIGVEHADLCQDLIGAHVQERATEVRAVGTRPADPCRQRAHTGTYEVALERPLGDREATIG